MGNKISFEAPAVCGVCDTLISHSGVRIYSDLDPGNYRVTIEEIEPPRWAPEGWAWKGNTLVRGYLQVWYTNDYICARQYNPAATAKDVEAPIEAVVALVRAGLIPQLAVREDA